MTDSAMDRLAALLDAERTALLEGDFDRIADLLEEKATLVADLDAGPLNAETVAPLRDGLRRNQVLFDHALAGLRNVAARLGDLNRIRKSMDTYDAQGRRNTIDAPSIRTLERRA
ncbi:flagellar protein FlgN [Ponticoccus sp. (in: a-proteobacteria)]|uniref:flagellar protein FlgN n=1 Tax=Ponticoccus sp. (in: a-proteobacteria) TaxID=1925025 RepID=UPI003AB65226